MHVSMQTQYRLTELLLIHYLPNLKKNPDLPVPSSVNQNNTLDTANNWWSRKLQCVKEVIWFISNFEKCELQCQTTLYSVVNKAWFTGEEFDK